MASYLLVRPIRFKQPCMSTNTTTTTTNIVLVVLYVKDGKQCQTDALYLKDHHYFASY
jgi:hypothetical protein